MKRQAFEELLSAYIDDELSPRQRERVEQELARSPEAAQLLEELRATVRLVSGLPRESLADDFADQLAGHIERRVLLAPSPRPKRRRRWLAWTGASAAVAGAAVAHGAAAAGCAAPAERGARTSRSGSSTRRGHEGRRATRSGGPGRGPHPA